MRLPVAFLIALQLIFNCNIAIAQPGPVPGPSNALLIPNNLSDVASPSMALNNILPSIASGHVFANGTSGNAKPADTAPSTWFDKAYCNTVGYIIVRTTGMWTCSNAIPLAVTWMGAKCDWNGSTGTDDTIPINSALATGAAVYVPPRTQCSFVGPLRITVSGTQFFGAGWGTSKLVSTSTTAKLLEVAAGEPYISVHDLGFDRSVTALSGADGLYQDGDNEVSHYYNLDIQHQWIGALFETASDGEIDHIHAYNNQSHNFYFTNTANCTVAYGSICPIQWLVHDLLAETSVAGSAYVIAPVAGPTQITLGQWNNIYSFSNNGYGLTLAGSGISIQGFRLNTFFFGNDGGDEIHLDSYNTYAGPTLLENGYTELGGAAGINVTANNHSVSLQNISNSGHAGDCVDISPNTSGDVVLMSQIIGQHCTGYGLVVAAAAYVQIGISNFNNNTAGDTSITGVLAQAVGNIPNSLNSITGTTTNDNAQAGKVGEIISSGLCPGPATTATVTTPVASPGIVNWAAHGIVGACPVVFTGGTLPTGITTGTTYYVIPSTITTGTFEIALTVANALAGTAINFTGTSSGTQTGTAGVALTSPDAATITGVSLTAGDWDCRSTTSRTLASNTSVTKLETSINSGATTIDTQGKDDALYLQTAANVMGVVGQDQKIGPARKSVASTTNEFLVVEDTFSASTDVAFGTLTCRRMR